MKKAADFRRIARNALSGRWLVAVLAGLIASLLGAISSGGSNISLHSENGNNSIQFAGQDIINLDSRWIVDFLDHNGAIILIAVIAVAIAFLILGCVVSVGYSKFNLDLVDRRNEPEIGTLFGQFHNCGTIVAAGLLQFLYVFLWCLLFIIPGIIAAYSYAMTNYILAENPDLTASEAITRSKEMMSGNRWRLFCLQLSFIGWDLLCLLTLGIGNLWLTPYKQAAIAAFYREVSGSEHTVFSTVEG